MKIIQNRRNTTLKGYIITFACLIIGGGFVIGLAHFIRDINNEQVINGIIIDRYKSSKGSEVLDVLEVDGDTNSYYFWKYPKYMINKTQIGDSINTFEQDTTVRIYRDDELIITLPKYKFYREKKLPIF